MHRIILKTLLTLSGIAFPCPGLLQRKGLPGGRRSSRMTARWVGPIRGGGRDGPLFRNHLPFVGNCHNPFPSGERTYATDSQAIG